MLCSLTHQNAVELSLYEEGRREAERHKWIESQKRGRDLGQWALKDWFCRFWPHFCRAKCIEHLQGMQRWREFRDEQFGQLYVRIVEGDLLVDRVLDRVYGGQENLDILLWAIDWGISTEEVVAVLTEIDMNRARLDPTV